MARKKATDEMEEEVAVATEVLEEKDTREEVDSEKVYSLNGFNFTAVGEHFITLCNPVLKLKSTEKTLIEAAEEQVKLGFLKVGK